MIFILNAIICSLCIPISFYIIVPHRAQKWRELVSLLGCALIMFVPGMFVTSEFVLPIVFIGMGLVLYFGYKANWYDLFIIPSSYVVLCVLNLVIDLAGYQLLGLPKEIVDSDLYSITNAIIMFAIMVFLSFMTRFLCKRFSVFFANKYGIGMLLFLGADILLFAGVVLINNWIARVNNYDYNIRFANLVLYFSFAILISIVMMMVLKTFKEKDKVEHDKQQYENLVEYSKQIESMYTNLRSFKHDYVNIISTLSGFIDDKNYDGLVKYFNENILPTSARMSKDNYRLNQLKNIQDVAIKGLVSSKLIYAHEMGIDVYIDIIEPIESFHMKAIDIGRIFGIFLDNAIEASINSVVKEIKFNIAKSDKTICIVIMNTYADEEIPLHKINQQGFSTKGENRGLGLYNVKQLLKNYENVYQTTEVRNGYFTQQIEIEHE